MLRDSVIATAGGQEVPNGYYNTGKAARGLPDDRLVTGAHRSSMSELAEWTTRADKVINV